MPCSLSAAPPNMARHLPRDPRNTYIHASPPHPPTHSQTFHPTTSTSTATLFSIAHQPNLANWCTTGASLPPLFVQHAWPWART